MNNLLYGFFLNGFSLKSGRNQRGMRLKNRSLRFEACEDRQLLSANPLVGAPQVTSGESSIAEISAAPFQQMGAFVITDHVWDHEVDPSRWNPTVTLAQEDVIALGPGTLLNCITYPGVGDDGALSSATLWADLMDEDGNWGVQDGRYETNLDTTTTSNYGTIQFDLGSWGIQVPQTGLPLRVLGDIHTDAPEQEFQLGEPTINMTQWGRPIMVQQFGPENPTITIDRASVDLSVGLNGPAEAHVGDTLGYSITVFNNGPDWAENMDVSVTVPTGTVFNPNASSVKAIQGDGQVVYHIDWMNDPVTETIAFDVIDDVEQVQVRAKVSSTIADPNLSNNSATVMTNVVSDDGLVVELSSTTPVADTIPQGSVVHMMSFELTAAQDEPILVEDVILTHEGMGDSQDIRYVYLSLDGQRITRARTIDSEDQTIDLRFSHRALTIDPNETVTLDVFAAFNTDATFVGMHNFVLESPSDIRSAGDVEGNFPIRGNTFMVAAVESGTVTVDYNSVQPDSVSLGMTQVVIGAFDVSADFTEDQTFYSMTFEQNSSASDGDFTNIAVRRTDGTVLTNTVASTVDDFVTLNFDPPFTVLEGDSVALEVVADIVGGAGDSIIMHFEESSDISALGSLYGYGINGQTYGSPVHIPYLPVADTVTIGTGEFTLGIDGPSTQNYTRDDNDAVLANIEMLTGSVAVDVKDMYVLVFGQNASGDPIDVGISHVMEDVEIRNLTTGRTIDGTRLTGPSDYDTSNGSTNGTYQIYRFGDFIVNGEETWEFRVDFIDNGSGSSPQNGDKFKIMICGDPQIVNGLPNSVGTDFGGILPWATTAYQLRVEGLNSGEFVSDVRPTGVISGNFHEISVANLTVVQDTLASSDTAVSNQKDITLLRLEATASEAEDILLIRMSLVAEQGSLLNCYNYSFWVDTDGNSSVDTILEDGVYSQLDQIIFSDFAQGGYVIPSEDTVVFEVHADVAQSLSSDRLQLGFAIDTHNFIEAEELDDGSSMSGITINDVPQTSYDEIFVTTAKSTEWMFESQGRLSLENAIVLPSHQVLGGELSEPLLRMNFNAYDEPVDVTYIGIDAEGENRSIDRFELFFAGETEPFAFAFRGSAEVGDDFGTYMLSRSFVVNEGEERHVLVRAKVKSDVDGGVPGDRFTPVVNQVYARGDASGRSIQVDATILGSENTVVMAKITSIENASNIPNGSPMPMGRSDVGAFKFVAAEHENSRGQLNDVAIDDIMFTITVAHVKMDPIPKIYNTSNSSDASKMQGRIFDSVGTLMTSAFVGNGTYYAVFEELYGSVVDTAIYQGDDLTLALEMVIQDPSTSVNGYPSSLEISFESFSDPDLDFGLDGSHISVWDIDDVSEDYDWLDLIPESVIRSTLYSG